MPEACQIVILHRAFGVVDVAAPMKHKELCYDILADAARVIEATPDTAFSLAAERIVIVMQMTGLVDVGAPLPPRAACARMLAAARAVIERYDDAQAPVMKAFSGALLGD